MRGRLGTALAVAQVVFVIVALIAIFSGDVFVAGGESEVQLVHSYRCSWWNIACKTGRAFHYNFGHLI